MFEKFKEQTENQHEYAREWKKRTGGKVIGYLCTYAPEEIMYAANILPVRILGSREPQSITDSHIFAMYCPFCRDCLAQGLQGRYDYLDGIMISHSCLHIRQTFYSWQLHVPVDFRYYMPMPNHLQSPRSIPYLAEELKAFKQAVEKWTGRKITEEEIEQANETYNTNRRLMRQVYETRKRQNPPLTGLEAMYMVLSSQLTDKAEHNNILSGIVPGLPERNLNRPSGVRLMLIGSEQNDTAFVEMLEGLNSTVVIDDHCTGSRYFWNESPRGMDIYTRIATRYVQRPPCPSKDWPERTRIAHMKNLIQEYGVQGVILIQQKFCDPHESDLPVLRNALKAMGIPTYSLEFDMAIPVGQFKIRLEAFLELFEQELLFGEL